MTKKGSFAPWRGLRLMYRKIVQKETCAKSRNHANEDTRKEAKRGAFVCLPEEKKSRRGAFAPPRSRKVNIIREKH